MGLEKFFKTNLRKLIFAVSLSALLLSLFAKSISFQILPRAFAAKGEKKFTTQSTSLGDMPPGLNLPSPPPLGCVYPNPMVPQPQCNMGAFDLSTCGVSEMSGLDDVCDPESTALPPFGLQTQVLGLAQQKIAALNDCDQRVAKNKQLYQCLKTQAENLKNLQQDLFKRNIAQTLQNAERFFDLAVQAQNKAEQLKDLLVEKEQKLQDLVTQAENLRGQANQTTSQIQAIVDQSKAAEKAYKLDVDAMKNSYEPRILQAKNTSALSCFQSPVPGLRCESGDKEPLTVCGYLSCMTQYYANNARVSEEGQVTGDRNTAETPEQRAADKKAADFDVICGNIQNELAKADNPVDRLPSLLAQYNSNFNQFADGSSKIQGRSYSERLSRVYLNCFTAAEQNAEVQGLRREYDALKKQKKTEFETAQAAFFKDAKDQVEQIQSEFQRVANQSSEFGIQFNNPAVCTDKKGVEQALCIANGYKEGITNAMYKTPVTLRLNLEGGFGIALTGEGILNLKNKVTAKTEQMKQYILNIARYLEQTKEAINNHVKRCMDSMTGASESARRNLKYQVENLTETVGAGDAGLGELQLDFTNLSQRNDRTSGESQYQLVNPQDAFGQFRANAAVPAPLPAIMASLNASSQAGTKARQDINDAVTKFGMEFGKCTAQIQKNLQKEAQDKQKEELERKEKEQERLDEKRKAEQERIYKASVAAANNLIGQMINTARGCATQADCKTSFGVIQSLVDDFTEISGIRSFTPVCDGYSDQVANTNGDYNCTSKVREYEKKARDYLHRANQNDAGGAF